MRAERSSTIGMERLTNYALQIKTKDEFVHQLTSNLPARPEYFSQDAEINRKGASVLGELPELTAISADQLKRMLEEGGFALDVRSADEFAAGHVPGSVNIPLQGQFASWAGAVLGLNLHPVLIADSVEKVAEARVRLARVGIDDLSGYLEDGVEGWKESGFHLKQVRQITVQDLQECLHVDGTKVLDVRRAPEWQAGHLEDALWWPLDNFRISPPEINPQQATAVHCKSGYRSMIACSLLQRAGFDNIVNVIGGFDAWEKAQLPVSVEKTVAV